MPTSKEVQTTPASATLAKQRVRALERLRVASLGPVVTGAVVGILAPVLVLLGNPPNMGICVACFTRDIAGALGLHRAAEVQYLRPEISGFVLGAFTAALTFREFRPRAGSAPLVRFLLGAFGMIGALVFLGCPWRAYLRLSAGDWNAIPGIAGLVVGVQLGVAFFRRGFSLGRSRPAPAAAGWIMPVLAGALLALLVVSMGDGARQGGAGPVFFSTQGPGSRHAPVLISVGVGLLVGFLAQRSRFCSIGAIRDLLLMRDAHLFSGVVSLVLAAFVVNVISGQFHPGIQGQPAAHTSILWNFGGMLLAGLAFTLAGGCPARQLFLAGEGDADAGVLVLGMLVGAAFAHNFNLASSSAGPSAYGPAAVGVGLAVCLLLGLTMREGAGE